MEYAPTEPSVPERHAVRTLSGEEAQMHCRDIMKTDVLCLREYDSVARAAAKMREGNVGFLPVCDEQGRVLGTLTDRDIALRVCAEDRLASGVQSADVMTREVISCHPDDSLEKAADMMQEHQKSRLVVIDDDGVLVGVISLSDVARWGEADEVSRTVRAVADREARP